ncbi:MAG: hypothetical protein HC895_10240 [Leptolyngbyaceae cyanobacterium SM1_3_5]|nr:hypothetical protein [Leptolyngbyaceae cyanobacterium SM1_3_5]
MKGILGIGIVSLLIGGGLGFAGSNAVIRPGAIVTGACIPLETAAKTGALTPQQAQQLGASLAKTTPIWFQPQTDLGFPMEMITRPVSSFCKR